MDIYIYTCIYQTYIHGDYLDFPNLTEKKAKNARICTVKPSQLKPRSKVEDLWKVLYDERKKIYIYYIYIFIYDPGSRFAATPPPHMVWSQNLAFCSIPHENVCICSVFCMVGLLARSANLQIRWIFANQPSENVLFAMFWLPTSWSSAAAPSSISMSNCHIILNLLLRVYSLGTRLISVYILCLSNFLLECLVFRNWSNLKFS